MLDPGDGRDTGYLVQSVQKQVQKLSLSIGRGVSQNVIDTVMEPLTSAPRHSDYIKYDEMPFVYEKLDELTNEMVALIVDDWIQVRIVNNCQSYY